MLKSLYLKSCLTAQIPSLDLSIYMPKRMIASSRKIDRVLKHFTNGSAVIEGNRT